MEENRSDRMVGRPFPGGSRPLACRNELGQSKPRATALRSGTPSVSRLFLAVNQQGGSSLQCCWHSVAQGEQLLFAQRNAPVKH
jgi:hypothetical protein